MRYARLFQNRKGATEPGRLEALLTAVDLDPKEFDGNCETAACGRQLRIWNEDRSKAVIISKGQKPRVVRVPPHSYINDAGQAVATLAPPSEAKRIVLSDGTKIVDASFCVDPDGLFFSLGGPYYDYISQTRKIAPRTLRCVSTPENIIAQCPDSTS